MAGFQSLPAIWLVSDARNDAVLADALRRLPRGSGFIYRHTHLPPAARRARFDQLVRIARTRSHLVILAGDMVTARTWGADGAYGPADRLASGPAGFRLVSAHSLRELGRAPRADALLLSPVFATRTHPGAAPLGRQRFLHLARRAASPVIALGGMNATRARTLRWPQWAGIDAFLQQGRLPE